ncbi:MAG: hypothetical protein PHO41_02470 [Eubacteriales bacterium]|nr:hypothetical protein [Eubacteriales bacterium]
MEQWPATMGVYRVYSPVNGDSFVGFTRNLNGTYKRLRFELKLNACSYKALQAFWNACCGTVEFEVLEQYEPVPGYSDEELDAHLQALMLKHQSQLSAKAIQVQI